MPRSSKSTRARRKTETQGAEPTVTAATDTDTEGTVRELPFTVEVTPTEEGYRPDRSPAGRKRIPSPFEDILVGLKGEGWQNQPHDGMVVPYDTSPDGTKKFNTLASEPKNSDTGEPTGVIPSVADSNAKAILRELSKATKFLNSDEGGGHNLGLDVNVTEKYVQFNVRDKQKRKPRTAPGGGDVSDGEIDEDSSGDDE